MKTREDFLAAAHEAYRVYEKFMFKAATEFFGIAEPNHESVDAFLEREPWAQGLTEDFHLPHAGDNFINILMKGREIYREPEDKEREIIGGFHDSEGRWIAWTREEEDLPSQVRLGNLTMDAKWSILLRYVDVENALTIAGVELVSMEPLESRESYYSIFSHIGKQMGAPLARYAASDSTVLPNRLLWLEDTVRAELECVDQPGDPDEGYPGYRTYKLTISREQREDDTSLIGFAAERLLKE